MEMREKVMLKAGIFGVTLPVLTIPFMSHFPSWLVWSLASCVACALFHWLPPRIHRDLTPLRSALICVGAGVVSGGANILVEKLLS